MFTSPRRNNTPTAATVTTTARHPATAPTHFPAPRPQGCPKHPTNAVTTPNSTDLIQSLTAAYYRTVGAPPATATAREYRHGQADGLVTALSLVTGRDRLVITFRLWHGIPVGTDGDGWQAVNRAPSGADPDVQLRVPSGEWIPVNDRLAALGAPGGC